MKTFKDINKQLSSVGGLSSSLGATRTVFQRFLWLWFILGALVLGAVGWFVHHSVEETLREHLASELTTILGSDVDAIRVWTKDQKAIAQSLACSPSLRPPLRTSGDLRSGPMFKQPIFSSPRPWLSYGLISPLS